MLGYPSISLPDVGDLCYAKARSAPRPLGGVPIGGHVQVFRSLTGSQKQFDCNIPQKQFGVVSTAKQLKNPSLPQLTRQRSVAADREPVYRKASNIGALRQGHPLARHCAAKSTLAARLRASLDQTHGSGQYISNVSKLNNDQARRAAQSSQTIVPKPSPAPVCISLRSSAPPERQHAPPAPERYLQHSSPPALERTSSKMRHLQHSPPALERTCSIPALERTSSKGRHLQHSPPALERLPSMSPPALERLLSMSPPCLPDSPAASSDHRAASSGAESELEEEAEEPDSCRPVLYSGPMNRMPSGIANPSRPHTSVCLEEELGDEMDEEDEPMVMSSSEEEPTVSSATNGKRKKRRRKKKKRNMLRDITPLNMREAKEAFLADPSVNPMFVYTDSKRCKKACRKSEVCTALLADAIIVLDRVLAKFSSEEALLAETEGSMIETEEQVLEIVNDWLIKHQLEHKITVKFSGTMLAPASMKESTISVANAPIRARWGSLTSTLNHELGTHFMRRSNEGSQPWHKRRSAFGLQSDVITTEEGLACLNTHLGSNRWLWKAALHYYAVCGAARMSFAELYADLEKYLPNPARRWNEVLRVKRGVLDTSQPGCFAKDQCYFKGAVDILRNLDSIDFHLLYSGRLSVADLPLIEAIRSDVVPPSCLPYFLEDIDAYKEILYNIAEVNGIQTNNSDAENKVEKSFSHDPGD